MQVLQNAVVQVQGLVFVVVVAVVLAMRDQVVKLARALSQCS